MPRRPQRTAPYPVVNHGALCGLPLGQQTNQPSIQTTPRAPEPPTQEAPESCHGGEGNGSAPPPISVLSHEPCSPSPPALISNSTNADIPTSGTVRPSQPDQRQEQALWGLPRVSLMNAAKRAGLSRRAMEKHLAMRLGKSGEKQLLNAVRAGYAKILASHGRLPCGFFFPAQDHLAYLPIVDLWDAAEKMYLVDSFIKHFNITIYSAGANEKEATGVRVGNAPANTVSSSSPCELTGMVTSYTAGNGVSDQPAATAQICSGPAIFCPPNSCFSPQQQQQYLAAGQAQQMLNLPVMQQQPPNATWPPHYQLVGQQATPQQGLNQLYAEQLTPMQSSSPQMQGNTPIPPASQPTTAQQFQPQSQVPLLQAQAPASQTASVGLTTALEQLGQQIMGQQPVQHQMQPHGLQMQPLQTGQMQQHQMPVQHQVYPQGLQLHPPQTDQLLLQQPEDQHQVRGSPSIR